MKIKMLLERNATDEIIFDVKDLDHLKELMLNTYKLNKLFEEQEAKYEEIYGEVLDVAFEDISGKVVYLIEDNELIVKGL